MGYYMDIDRAVWVEKENHDVIVNLTSPRVSLILKDAGIKEIQLKPKRDDFTIILDLCDIIVKPLKKRLPNELSDINGLMIFYKPPRNTFPRDIIIVPRGCEVMLEIKPKGRRGRLMVEARIKKTSKKLVKGISLIDFIARRREHDNQRVN